MVLYSEFRWYNDRERNLRESEITVTTETPREPENITNYEQPPAGPYVSHTAFDVVNARNARIAHRKELKQAWQSTWLQTHDTPIERVLRMLDALEWPGGFIFRIEDEPVVCLVICGKMKQGWLDGMTFDSGTIAVCSNGRIAELGQPVFYYGDKRFQPHFLKKPGYGKELLTLEKALSDKLLSE